MIQNISHTNAARYEQHFVISACGFTFHGYTLFLQQHGINTVRLRFNEDVPHPGDVENIVQNQWAEICVFPGNDIALLLESLKKLASILNLLPVARRVTLYGNVPDSWLYRTLGSLIHNKEQLSMVRVARVCDITASFKNRSDKPDNHSRLLCEAYTDCSYKEVAKGLTRRELDVLLNFYRGMSVKEQCEKMGLSDKTVYTHRKEGVRKIQPIRVWLNDPHVLRAEGSSVRKNSQERLSGHEIDILNALLNGEIFPAYQIITDKNKKGVGFEILLRWNQNGNIVKPAAFLAGVADIEIWLKITALVIHAAVSGINKYNGKYYFSVNIPPQLASGNALPGMAKKATEMLFRSQWADKLVFEFAETIDVTKDTAIPETMRKLRNTGCRLFLDDCFSNHHTMFPVRHIHFDGLKLDRDIVEQFVANDNDYNLIKAIQIYSDMTGSECVAEGVDSEEKFEKLIALGVKNFQGYYLSRAVREDELDRMVRLFS